MPLPAYTIDACKLREMGKNNPPPEPNTSRELSVETARTKIYYCETSNALSRTLIKTSAIFGPTRIDALHTKKGTATNEFNPLSKHHVSS